jgi:uncharacterized protein YcbK (DUF882 family)
MHFSWIWTVLAGAAASMPVARPTAIDPPIQRSQGLTIRKQVDGRTLADGPVPADSNDGTVETLATLFNTHSGDAVPLSSTEPTASRFSELLADRVTGSRVEIDSRLLKLLQNIARKNPGARIEVVSGYRSAKLNEMLRKKGHNVASHSKHSLGHALDFRVVGMTPAQMARQISKLGWSGGLGEYDKPSDTFVHADVGPERQWSGGR